MSKLKLDLKVLENAVASPVATSNPHYFLFMLGTDTQYIPKPTKGNPPAKNPKAYENGETLSYTAQLVAHTLGETEAEINVDNDLSFSTSSVQLIKGPDTRGAYVGERIILGLFLVLKAIAEGKENIQISAHSRGAVQSILIAHELDRIKNELIHSPDKSIYDILLSSPCSLTKDAARKFINIKETKETRLELSKRLNKAKINLFLIDPVPGSGVLSLWEDGRFYLTPPGVRSEILICRDERTNLFHPIIPANVKPVLIPGHHGTASGNLYDQQSNCLPLTISGNKDTSLVQQLTVHKLIHFINDSTGLFEPKGELSSLQLHHDVLDGIVKNYIEADKNTRIKQLLGLYQSIHQSDAAYKHFTNTRYGWLGFSYSASKSRNIYDGTKKSSTNKVSLTSLDESIAILEGSFVNMEHVRLHLQNEINFAPSPQDGLIEAATKLKDELERLFKVYKEGDQKIVDLFNNKASRLLTFDALSSFVDELNQKYLSNHLSVEIKTQLLATIDEIFSLIDRHMTNEPADKINEIINDCKKILHFGIKNVTETHFKSLIAQSDSLNHTARGLLEIEPPAVSYLDLLNDLSHLHENIDNLINGKKHVEELANGKDLIKQLDEAKNNLTRQEKSDPVEDLAKTKIRIEELSKQVLILDSDLLEMHKLRVIRRATELLIKSGNNLRTCPNEVTPEFFKLIKMQAIALGAANPVEQDLREQIDVGAEQLLSDARVKQEANTKQISELQKTISELNSQNHEHKIHSTQQRDNISQLEEKLKANVLLIKQQDAKIKQQDKKIHYLMTELNKSTKELSLEIKRNTQLTTKLKETAVLLQDNEKASIIKLDKQLKQSAQVLLLEKAKTIQLQAKLKRATDCLYKLKLKQQDGVHHLEKIEEELENTVKHLKTSIKKQKEVIIHLKLNSTEQVKTINQLSTTAAAQQQLIEQLTSSKELSCANLINFKLIPLTNNYGIHLLKAAKKINPMVSQQDIREPLPSLPLEASENDKVAYEKINAKYVAIQELAKQLNNTSQNPLPSKRLEQFTRLLHQSNQVLSQYREPQWWHYFKCCLVAIDLICSKFIPELERWFTFSSYANKCSPLFFNKSSGEKYINNIELEVSATIRN